MAKTFKIKEVSELTAVTVRTLHYYDEIGLLKPSCKTQSSHRLYSEDDILRLQQITALKYMGFSLEKIMNIVSNPLYSNKDSLRAQTKMIKDETIRLQKVEKLLQSLVTQLDIDDTVDWTTVTRIIEVMQMGEIKKESWYEKYLSIVELKEFQELRVRFSDDYWELYNRRWEALYVEVESNLHTSPESETAMKLAKKWLDLVDEVYPRHSTLRKKMWEAYKAGIIPQNSLPHKQEVINYISVATEKLKIGQKRLG